MSMRIGNILNNERVSALGKDVNAYASTYNNKSNQVSSQTAKKVIFPEPYDNASTYYNKSEFSKPPIKEPPANSNKPAPAPMFDIKSLLPMLMSGKFGDMLKPFMSMIGGGGGGMDIAKVFELFKTKPKVKKEEESEQVSSKFEDLIIIED